MKRFSSIAILVIAFIATALQAQAQTQTRWGVTAGLNYNEIHFKQTDILTVTKGFGPQVGVTGEMNIPGVGFSVDASLLYAMRSGKINYGEREVWKSQGLGNETCMMHSIDVPLNLKFKYRKLDGLENTIMPMVMAGPTFSFLVAKNLNQVNQYRPVSVLLHMGVGAELFKKVQVSVNYNFNVGETLRTRVLDENNAKNRCWTVSATYFIK
ncbi:MAG: PorT family protein [Bacteroidales bacterium]|uniref:porin family protein n=1 Tax=Sodaliphilus sp. TaxID=2815818 RepID=UPI001B4DF6AD|nr:PorT family protein [Candidatus Sodaliphilus limicaballi]